MNFTLAFMRFKIIVIIFFTILIKLNYVFITWTPKPTPIKLEYIEEGIINFLSDLQALKMQGPRYVTDEGISTCVKEEQPQNAEDPISFTEEGI